MGWWGYGIMEGDTPCDCLGDIHEAVQDLQDPSVALQVLSDIQQNKLCEYATDVAIQVLAYTLMEHGVLPPEIKQAAIKATEAQMDVIIEEGWCDPDLRKQSLLSFIQQLNTF